MPQMWFKKKTHKELSRLSLVSIISPHTTGFKGVWTEQRYRTPCSDGPHTWCLMLCGCCLEILSIFYLNFCFVNEVWRTLEAWALESSAPRPSTGCQLPPSWQPAAITWCLGPWPTSPSPRLPSRLWPLLPSTQGGNWLVLCCETHVMRSMFFCDPLPLVGSRKARVGQVHPRNAFRQGVGRPCQGWQHHSCWGGRGGLARERPLVCPQPRYWTCPGTEVAEGFETHRLLQGSAARRRGPWLEGRGPGTWQDLHLPCEYPLSKEVTLNSKLKNTMKGQESKWEREEKLHIVPLTVHFFPCFLNKGSVFSFCTGQENYVASPAVLWSDHMSL